MRMIKAGSPLTFDHFEKRLDSNFYKLRVRNISIISKLQNVTHQGEMIEISEDFFSC